MWTAIVFFLLISMCVCDHRFSVLKGRGVHVVQINRLTSEEQCRQACQSPGASGEVLVPWMEFQLPFLPLEGLCCSFDDFLF